MQLKSDICPASEISEAFIQGMIDRMAVSFHKYGPVDNAKGKIDEIKSLELRVDKYKSTGNTEYLMDVANFAMIEFMHKGHKSYKPTDSSGSPGLVWAKEEGFEHEDAEISQRPHSDF